MFEALANILIFEKTPKKKSCFIKNLHFRASWKIKMINKHIFPFTFSW